MVAKQKAEGRRNRPNRAADSRSTMPRNRTFAPTLVRDLPGSVPGVVRRSECR